MTTKDQALKLALEALEIGHEYAVETAEHFHIEMAGYKQHRHDAMDAEVKQISDAITAIREALAEQPAQQQEPFGYFRYDLRLDAWVQNREGRPGTPFYTSPPAIKPWVGLTDEERGQVYASWRFNGSNSSNLELCQAIEAKLREKNANEN